MWSNRQSGPHRIHDRLDNGPFYNPLHLHVDLTINGSYHSPIATCLHIGNDCPYDAQSSFNLNVSLLESEECWSAIVRVWYFIPTPVGKIGWISWWETTILCTVNLF
jgi:hypothetical protein